MTLHIPGLDKSLMKSLGDKIKARNPIYYRVGFAKTGEWDEATNQAVANPTEGLPAGQIWTRASFNGGVTFSRSASPAINVGVRDDVTDIPILIGFDSPNEGATLYAIGVAPSPEASQQYGAYLAAMGVPRTPAAWNNQPSPASLTLDGMVTKSSSGGLTIAIQPFRNFLGVDPYDVSASVPSTAGTRRWAIVSENPNSTSSDPADAITLTNGAESSAPLALFKLTISDAEAIQIPAGDYPLAALLLEEGQTEIDDATIILDMRLHFGLVGQLLSEASETLTIATGAVSADGNSYFLIAAESGTADDLDTITMTGVQRVILLQADAGDTITVKNGTGNIFLNGGADFALSGDKTLALFWDGTNLADVSPNNGAAAGFYQTVQDNGVDQPQETKLNFIGATVTDNPGNNSTDVTIPSGGGSELGYTPTTSAFSTNSASFVDVTGVTVTVTVGTRPIKITFYCPLIFLASGAQARAHIAIVESSTVLGGAYMVAAGADGDGNVNIVTRLAPTAGSHTYKLQMKNDNGSGGTVELYADATTPMFILVEEL